MKITGGRSGLLLILWLGFTSAGNACSVEELLGTDYYESRVARGPERRKAKKPDARCYESFGKFKEKERPAGDGMEWHHIVGQHAANERKFGRFDLHCTDNLVRVPTSVHRRINGHYSSKDPVAKGKLVRDWLAEQSFDEQYEYGARLLQRHGIRP